VDFLVAAGVDHHSEEEGVLPSSGRVVALGVFFAEVGPAGGAADAVGDFVVGSLVILQECLAGGG